MKDKLALLGRRKYTILITLGLVGIICWCMAGILKNEDDKEQKNVSVIAENINDSRWIPFRLGMDQAAKDYNINVNYITSGQFSELGDEERLIRQVIKEKIDGLILSPYADEGMDEIIKNLPSDLRVVLVESDISRDKYALKEVKAVVSDYEEIGARLAQEVLKDNDKKLSGKTIVVFADDSQQKALKEAVDSFQEEVRPYGGEIILKENNSDDSEEEVLKSLRADIVAAMDDKSLKKAAHYLSGEREEEFDLYGIGCSESNIFYLDKNIIKSMVIPNEFTMGYQSLALIAQKKTFGSSEEEAVGYQVVRPEEIYDSDNEKLLFPIIQ